MRVDDVGPGFAAYCVTLELLGHLHDRGILSADDGVTILDAALAGLEKTAGQHPSAEPLTVARQMLERQIVVWKRDRPS